MKIEAYRKYRGRGYPAADAWSLSQAPGIGDLDWDHGQARWTQQGFLCVARQLPDDDPDLSYLGEFTDRWEPGDISHGRGNQWALAWFRPTITEIDHFEGLRQKKMGRTEARLLARRYAQDAYRRRADYGNG